MTPARAIRAYTVGYAIWMLLYAAVLVGVIVAIQRGLIPSGPIRYAAAIAPSIPIAGMVFSMAKYMRDTDEFIRALMTRRIVFAAGATFILTSAWGFLEGLADAPHIEAYWVFPLFCALMGLATPFIRDART